MLPGALPDLTTAITFEKGFYEPKKKPDKCIGTR
jgi:hypothetical protein